MKAKYTLLYIESAPNSRDFYKTLRLRVLFPDMSR